MKKLISIALTINISAICFSQKTKAFISTTKAKEDLNQLVETIEKVHYDPYFMYTKEEIGNYKKTVFESYKNDSISYKQLVRDGLTLTAKMSAGHTGMDWQVEALIPELKEHLFIPFTVKLTKDESCIMIKKSLDSSILIKQKIISINGFNAVQLFKECMNYVGGINTFKASTTENLFPLFLFFNERIKAPYHIEFENSESIMIRGNDINSLSNFLNSAYRKPDYTFEIIDNSIGLISYNSCNDYEAFQRFLKKTFKTIHEKDITKLIVDIRENTGGNSSLNDLLLSYLTTKPYRQSSGRYWKVSKLAKDSFSGNKDFLSLFGKNFMNQFFNSPNQSVIIDIDSSALTYPKQPENFYSGKSCFLIGPNTFSSANFLADAIKTFEISTLIGLATGENTNDFGEQISFRLNHSGAFVYVASTYDIGASGNPKIKSPVIPDIEVSGNALGFAKIWSLKD